MSLAIQAFARQMKTIRPPLVAVLVDFDFILYQSRLLAQVKVSAVIRLLFLSDTKDIFNYRLRHKVINYRSMQALLQETDVVLH